MIDQKHVDGIKSDFDGRFAGDARHRFEVGDIGFLRDSPARTAFTLTDVLFGLIQGKTQVEALGVAKVVEVAKNGRGKLLTLWGEDMDKALEELGYPEISRDVYIASQDD
jgi:hypothetical protein